MDIGKILEQIRFESMLWLLLIPVAMMAIDIITGLLNAWVTESFESSKMRSGLAKKCGEMMTILIGIMLMYGVNLPSYIVTGVSAYIIFMEFMSIMENLDKLGVPVPAFVRKVINNVDDTLRNDDYEEIKRKIEELNLEAIIRARDRPDTQMDDGK